MKYFNTMKEFIVHHILYTELLDGNDFMNLANTCTRFRRFNTHKRLKKLWKHGKVKNVKTALYVEHKLKIYKPTQILDEAITPSRESEVVSALRRLLSRDKMRAISKHYKYPALSLFLHERATPLVSLLGKRNKHYI